MVDNISVSQIYNKINTKQQNICTFNQYILSLHKITRK